MTDRLKVTLTDIEQTSPDVLSISVNDLPMDAASRGTTAVLRITVEDIWAVASRDSGPNTYRLEQLMWQLINQARQAYTLPRLLHTSQLRWHEGLAQVARYHSQDMLERHFVEHISPEGVTAVQRIQRAGIGYLACGENIGVVYGSNSHSEAAVHDIYNAFMQQPRGRMNNHRGNLLNPFWTHVGIGIVYSPNGALFATQNFISAL